jgi:hypothetical protein
MARLYISADQMDRWTAEGKVSLQDDLMTLPAMKRSFRLTAAVRFLSVVEGADQHALVGRVKSDAQVAELGGEHYGASVILGEIGYECEEGFLGTPADPSAAGSSGASGLLKLTPS